MEAINLEKAKKIYKLLSKKRDLKQNKGKTSLEKFPFLILSNLFDRDFGTAEFCINETYFLIGFKGFNLERSFFLNLNDENKALIFIGRLFSNKNKKDFLYNLFFSLSIFIKKVIFQLLRISFSFIDFILIILFALILIIFFRPFLKKLEKKNSVNELYSLTYIKSKKGKSIEYFYPDFWSRKSKKAFITNFHEFKFIFNGILKSYFEKNLINAIHLISLKDLFTSIYSLFFIYVFDFLLLRDFSFGKMVAFFESLKFINRKFYYLLCFYSVKYLVKFQPKTIYIWTENQQHSKSISYLLARKISKNKKLKIKCISYIGYPYFSSFHPHLKPSIFELENQIWGKNCFMFCDYESLQEFERSVRNVSCKNIETIISREGLKRHKPIDFKLVKKFKSSKSRKFTFFSHSSINDFISMIRCLYFYREKINFSVNDKIYIRLHPTLTKEVVIKLIQKLSFFDNDTFIFLNPLEEQIDESILMSEYCIFADSNLINRALLLNSKVIVCRISFFFDPPIYSFNKNNKNLTFL